MWEDGRPRFWIEDYDKWHLALPAALVGVLVWLFTLPAPPALPARPAPPVLVALSAPTLVSPTNNSRLRADRLGEAAGRVVPGAGVGLFYSTGALTWRELGRIPSSPDGTFRFALANFPTGTYRLRTTAWMPDGRSTNSASVEIVVTPAPKTNAPPVRRRRGR